MQSFCSNHFDCFYVNRPFCTLKPFCSITPCPRFSCPPSCVIVPGFERPCFNDCPCYEQTPPFCPQPQLNPNLIWFLGGMCYGSRRRTNRFLENG
ncbi:MAG: hypothetical protein MSA34_01115 [Firmicutes bacterium]|nr:hypothetical protein [Bacillota bacterium]MDY5586488.1 hypothetical protein [Eubacteriales bacterium]